MRLLKNLRNKNGMSLLEVLIALGIFSIGILMLVKIFPVGFTTIKHTEASTLSQRLAQAELERLKTDADNLPSGILGWDSDGTPILDIDTQDMSVLQGLPSDVDPYYYTDVNKFRHIYAECTKIPMPAPGAMDSTTSEGSTYILKFAPVADPSAIQVYSGPMRRRPLGVSLRSTSDYSIDYEEAMVYVSSVNYDRKFRIRYSYWKGLAGSNPELQAVLGKEIIIPAQATEAQIPGLDSAWVKNDSGFLSIEDSSDTLHRSFILLAESAEWNPNDPYQYKIRTQGDSGSDKYELSRRMGIVAFNPYGYGYEEVTARGKVPLVAYIDYDVLDWHIIREERKVPSWATSATDPDLKVKLTLRFIKQKGHSKELDGSFYGGLAPSLNGLAHSIVATDMENGLHYDEDDTVDYNGTTSPAFTVDFKNGIISFNPYFAGRTLRIYYRGDDDWAMQVYKTYDSYSRIWTNDLSNIGYNQYYMDNAGKLYFAKCYNGGSVGVDYIYSYTEGGQTVQNQVTGEVSQITQDTVGSKGYCIDLKSNLAKSGHPDATIIKVSRVYGVSVGVKVIWRDTGSGFIPGRWKKADLQTYLIRADR